ncbi:hypothetical protein [Nocardia gipuzkoensis]
MSVDYAIYSHPDLPRTFPLAITWQFPPNPFLCDHLMIRVPSASASNDGKVRRMCVNGCGHSEIVEPDAECLEWKNARYGREYSF